MDVQAGLEAQPNDGVLVALLVAFTAAAQHPAAPGALEVAVDPDLFPAAAGAHRHDGLLASFVLPAGPVVSALGIVLVDGATSAGQALDADFDRLNERLDFGKSFDDPLVELGSRAAPKFLHRCCLRDRPSPR